MPRVIGLLLNFPNPLFSMVISPKGIIVDLTSRGSDLEGYIHPVNANRQRYWLPITS